MADVPDTVAPLPVSRGGRLWRGLKGLLLAVATHLLATASWGQAVPATDGPAASSVAPVALDAQGEARLHALLASLRCVVCQNQSLADSHAPLAEALKLRVREQLVAGLSDDQVRQDLVQRFGDFVLYQPPFGPLTWGLWLGPLALLLLGAALLWRRLRAPVWPDSQADELQPSGDRP